jgi:hypothetical protein
VDLLLGLRYRGIVRKHKRQDKFFRSLLGWISWKLMVVLVLAKKLGGKIW